MHAIPITLDQQPATLLDQARWLYEHKSDALAVTMIHADGETAITYGEFFRQAARYAHALDKAGIKPGDLVALILQHGEDVLYGFWGAMLLGAVPSVFPFLTEKLDRTRYFESIRALVGHESIPVAITYSDLQADLAEHLADKDITLIDKDTLQPGGDIEMYLRLNPAQPADTAFLQHSSGSTGLQKGVMLSHQAVINHVASYSTAIALQPDDVVVSWLPLYHDMGLIAGFIMPILQGLPLVLMSPFQWVRDPKMLLMAIHRHKGTLCWLPNFAYNFLATRVRDKDIAGLDLSSMRAFVNCSEPVYVESHRQFVDKFAAYGLAESTLMTCYAMAENTFAVTQAGIGGAVRHDVIDRERIMADQVAAPASGDTPNQIFVSCGKPIPHCDVKIVSSESPANTLDERHVGEVAVRSNSMLSGYFARPDLSAEALHDGFYLTGDMGYLAEGELYITGRKKDLVIVGGKNVYPQDIENLLNDIDGLYPGRATAFGVFNDRLGTEDLAIVAEVQPEIDPTDREATAPIVREIRNRVGQSTDVAARFVHLVGPRWLIKTSSGKIARRANRDKFMDEVVNRRP